MRDTDDRNIIDTESVFRPRARETLARDSIRQDARSRARPVDLSRATGWLPNADRGAGSPDPSPHILPTASVDPTSFNPPRDVDPYPAISAIAAMAPDPAAIGSLLSRRQRRRVGALAHANEAYVIDESTAHELLAEGYASDDRGRGLEPPRTLIWITADRAARLADLRQIELRLGAELLAARCLALVPFP